MNKFRVQFRLEAASPASPASSLIGIVLVGYDGHRGWVYYLAVDASHRGSGIERALMEAAEAWLQARRAVTVQLVLRSSNDAVLDFYDHLGYEEAEVQVRAKWLR